MKYWNFIFYILASLPFGFIIPILSFYIHATYILGYFPSYNNPDPKELGIYINYSYFIEKGLGIWIVSLPIWVLLTIIYASLKRNQINKKIILICSISQLIGIFILFSGIFEWYVD